MKTVFTNGCFDVLHKGHIELLRHCKSLGYVVVGLNSDSSVRRLKGENRPFNNQEDRKNCELKDYWNKKTIKGKGSFSLPPLPLINIKRFVIKI